MLNEVPHY